MGRLSRDYRDLQLYHIAVSAPLGGEGSPDEKRSGCLGRDDDTIFIGFREWRIHYPRIIPSFEYRPRVHIEPKGNRFMKFPPRSDSNGTVHGITRSCPDFDRDNGERKG